MSKTEELYRNRVPRTRHDTHVYERTGHTMPWFVPSTSLDALQTFEVRSTDIFLITYPKSGTTWTRKIITLVMNDANEEMIQANIPISMKASLPEFHRNLNEEPWYKKLEKTNGRRFIPTHLAPSLLPPQVFEKPVKVIYVARNPKDAAVSYYHHYMTSPDEMPYKWEDYLSIFRSKNMAYGGDWGSHVIPWWERRNNLNVLFMKYEDMVKVKLAVGRSTLPKRRMKSSIKCTRSGSETVDLKWSLSDYSLLIDDILRGGNVGENG
ncbi:sulfotransferase 1B1-like isoform X2 [Ptychodera flava]|uniref:sulfotransferase 1B1-like isoform X2 n=1 Tax=Ptychodera flava TaxID=63121 RepID=UPI003969F6A1